MASLTQSIATYSFVDRPALDLSASDFDSPGAALLATIHTIMASAATAFTARKYDAAISAYHSAESLIYAHLDPQWSPELGGKFRPVLPRDATLFTPLLSASSQWLNVLAVPTATSPVRPTTPVNPQTLVSISSMHGAGLAPVSSNSLATFQSLADLKLASIYTTLGNTAASDDAITRARSLDAAITGILDPLPQKVPLIATPEIKLTTPTALPAGSDFRSLPISTLAQKQVGVLTGTPGAWTVKPIQWAANSAPSVTSIIAALYTPHITVKLLPDPLSNIVTLWERSLTLPHDYFYTIPLALAQCYQALGDYATAETYYLQAGAYPYLNTTVEGPYVFVQLATLYLVWGNSFYQQADRTSAATIYSKALTVGASTPPSTPLYTLAGLASAAAIAKTIIPQLATLSASGISSLGPDDIAIATILFDLHAKLGQINAGLDFWGIFSAAVPIWTFIYLQQVAVNMSQLALQAEQQVVNFWVQSDQATLTKTQLANQASQANAQITAAQQQVAAAQAQVTTYQSALKLAQTRAADAAQDATEFQSTNSQSILIQATGTQVGGGDDGDPSVVQSLASQFMAGQTISTSNPTLAAVNQYVAGQISQGYQVDSMNRTTTEMQQAVAQAQTQLQAAQAQVTAAQANLAVVQCQANGASQNLAVFDANTFTPQVWLAMGNFMDTIYQRYFNMALQAAKLMQQAYNFENDVALAYIQNSYQGVIDGLFAADALLADIQTFTNDYITATRGKKQLVKTSISLASNFGYQFETQLRKTGAMTFETTLDNFDSAFPGSYQGRIRGVSVSVQGIVPPTGISGSLTNGGISVYRLPSDLATPAKPSKIRLQNPDTLVLSDYDSTVDGLLDSTDTNQMGIFEGAGVASTWTLSLPPQLNDINYGTLTDVVLTFLYETRYDAQLTSTVLSQLASRPGYYSRERAIPLAWLYPDLFYAFASTGTLTLNLAKTDFPTNQTKPVITAISLLVCRQGASAAGITIALTAPGKAPLTGVTDSTGAISSQATGSPWAAAVGGSSLGNWVLTLTAAANPTLAPGGVLNLSSLLNLVLVLDYTFTPRS